LHFIFLQHIHTDKPFLNRVNPKQIWIVITIFSGRFSTANGIPIAVLNPSENVNHNSNLVWINEIQKIFLKCFLETKITQTVRQNFLCTHTEKYKSYSRQTELINTNISQVFLLFWKQTETHFASFETEGKL